jgi:LPXTG-motif cell wall-anchored protein
MFADFLETMDQYLGNVWVMVTMGVVVLGLIGLLLFLRNKRDED